MKSVITCNFSKENPPYCYYMNQCFGINHFALIIGPFFSSIGHIIYISLTYQFSKMVPWEKPLMLCDMFLHLSMEIEQICAYFFKLCVAVASLQV